MINFFRHIRKQLLNQGKTVRYFKYAIGEIVLVVIGILIALQVNNWNKESINRVEEIKKLKGIKLDLQKDISSLDYHIKFRTKKIQSARQVIKHIDGEPINDYTILNNDIYDIVGSIHFKETNITFNELLSSGSLNIISNDSIKNLLLQLQSLYKNNKGSREHELHDYNNYVSKPYFHTVDLYPSLLLSEKSDKKGVIKKDQIDTLLRSVTFKNGCINAIWMSNIYLSSFPVIKENSIKLINLIDKELEY